MAEELRFFLRIALFALVISIVYWFVSYDVVGTFLLGFLLVGAGIFVATFVTSARAARAERDRERERSAVRRVGRALGRTLGLEDRSAAARRVPLELDEDPLPPSSVWPLASAAAALLIALGLVFGAWFWLPGLALGAAAACGWLTQLR